MLIHFGQSTYFKANKGVDRYFLENYLLPGLEAQAVIAGGSKGIELPVGENQEPEYITLDEAKALVLDWLTQSNNLLESDKKKLERLKNYQQFANLASNIYQAKVQDPNKLVTAARLQNVADLRAAKKAASTTATPKFDPGKVIDDYNKAYLKLLSSSRVGIPHSLLQQIVSGGLPASGAGNLREDALAAVISANLSRLYAAGSVGTSIEARSSAVANELGNIIKTSYPEMTGLLNILGDAQTASSLHEVTNRLAKELESTTSLEQYEKLQTAAVAATDNYLLNQAELRTQINNAFPSMNAQDRQVLTNALLTEIVSSAGRPLTATEIAERVGEKMKIPPAQLAAIQTALADSGLDVSLEYRQNEISLLVGTRHLTLGERNLLSKGINPFLVQKSPEKLASQESRLLAEYNALPTHPKPFITLREAYLHELNSDNPNLSFLERTRSHFAQTDAYSNLSLSDRALVSRTRFGRWVTETRSRAYETQAKFFDKWIDIEETITGKKWLNKQLDNWDKFAEGFTIPGTKIPLFRVVPWISDRIDEWKKVNTLNILTRTAGSKSWVGKTIHWTFKHYELGGFTVNGATAHFASAQWGKIVKWSLAKTGMTGVVKYAGVSASRTATRLLIKIGGKALAKLGAKAIGALVTAATAIGTVLFAIGMVLDVIQIGWQFLKEFIRNSQFRKTVIKWAAGISLFFSTLNIGTIFTSIGIALVAMFGAALQFLLIAVGIALVSLFVVPQIISRNNDGFYLDSGISAAVANVVCNALESDTTAAATTQSTASGSENSAVSAAKCIYDFLEKFKINPLTASNATGAAWNAFVTALGNTAASFILGQSATGQGVLQCVGYIAGVGAMIGKPFNPINACSYVNKPPSGYSWTTKPTVGCFFVVGSSTCSQCGIKNAPAGSCGHVGVVSAVKGAIIDSLDANGSSVWGQVRASAQFPTSSIAGYMCP
jgi:plasmid stability protein